MKMLIILLIFASHSTYSQIPDPQKKKLTIYAYSSFVSAWGPGPQLVENFKKKFNCEVDLTDMGDSNLVIDKLARTKATKVDVVVGLDQLLLKNAQSKLQWMSVKALQKKDFIGGGDYDNFVAFDWAPLAFVYRKGLLDPPTNLDELLQDRFKNQILLQDPRLSTPGLQFLAWIHLVKKDQAKNFLKKLKGQIHSVSPSWSTAYGLFKKEQAQLVFSYLTSPVYHWKEEKDESYQSLAFEEKHPVQTEWAGIPKSCSQCKLASEFIRFLLSDESQRLLMNSNYMLPVNKNLIKSTLYEKLPTVKTFDLREYKRLDVEGLIGLWKDTFK